MAFTVTSSFSEVPGAAHFIAGSLTFDTSYPTGGLGITGAQLNGPSPSRVLWMLLSAPRGVASSTAVAASFDSTNSKVLVYNSTGGSEVVNGTNLSSVVVDFIALVR